MRAPATSIASAAALLVLGACGAPAGSGPAAAEPEVVEITPAQIWESVARRDMAVSWVGGPRTFAEALPNHLQKLGDAAPMPTNDGLVIGTIERATALAGFYELGNDECHRVSFDSQDPKVTWYEAILQVRPEKTFGAGVQGQSPIRVIVSVGGDTLAQRQAYL